MQIGEVIRKYRKIKNMTQEEMANCLGVTAPAVNKWENGNSMPDILLLAPIARLLDITLDNLLSFQEELTDDEVNGIIREADSRLKHETYGEAFQWAKKKMEQYPNCERLILWMAQIFDVQRYAQDIPDQEDYGDYISKCYIRVLNSKNEDIRCSAADALFSFYVRKEQYKKAEEYLGYFSKQNPERKRKQALIYSKTNRINEAYKAYEELLFTGYQTMNMVFHSIYMLTMQEDREKAHFLIDKQKQLAHLFDMGEYQGVAPGLELAAAEKDIDVTIEIMERMLASMDDICVFAKSPLYEHMVFKDLREEFLADMKKTLLEQFRDEDTFGFLKNDVRYTSLLMFDTE